MTKVSPAVLLRVPLLVAIAASSVLVIEYRHAGDPAFCSAGSGCMKVRLSPYSSLFGVPLPVIGLAAYTLLFVLSLIAKEKLHHRVVAAVATIGGLAGATLIALQAFAVEAFCKWCMTVDVSGILAAGAAFYVLVSAQSSAPPVRAAMTATAREAGPLVAWSLGAALSVALPFVWSLYPVNKPLPPELDPYMAPGKLNVVAFTDFQCPFCRRLHPTLDKLRAANAKELHFSRLMMPLPHHDGALPAALAFECVPEPLKERLAVRLYTAPIDDLKTKTADIAESLGVDRASFNACVADPKTKAKVDHDVDLFKKIEGAGLPLTFVGNKVVTGANLEQLTEAFASARDVGRPELPVPLLWVALGAVYLAIAAFAQRAFARALAGATEVGRTLASAVDDASPQPEKPPVLTDTRASARD
jgi:uncharacterized membrane protein